MTDVTLHHGDSLAVLKTMPDCSIDAVVCDPPYGLSKEPNAREVLTHWLAGDDYKHPVSGFMGKSWDSFVPGPAVWAECLRVLKPGGHLVAFAGTRTVDLMGISLRLAGFEIRDELAWLYGSGFPKSLDVSKALDKMAGAEREVVGKRVRLGDNTSYPEARGGAAVYGEYPEHGNITAPATDAAREWSGWGTALKPAHEPILLCRKPLSERNVALNVLKHSTGAINVDGCRVGSGGETITTHSQSKAAATSADGLYGDFAGMETHQTAGQALGRWPANLLLSHAGACVRVGERKVKGSMGVRGSDDGNAMYGGGKGLQRKDVGQVVGYADPDGTETVAAYDCSPGCPVAALDGQSGVSKSADRPRHTKARQNISKGAEGDRVSHGHADQGGASRFFPALDFDPEYDAPFKYVAKAPKRERNAGLEGFEERLGPECGVRTTEPGKEGGYGAPRANHHPTVKPIALMRWLCRLITPPGGVVLDPFMGSGTTGCAAVIEGFRFIGIEREAEYVEIARARIEHWAKGSPGTPAQPDLFDPAA
jgi:DNA modification methylase